jgi:hypothetical protein
MDVKARLTGTCLAFKLLTICLLPHNNLLIYYAGHGNIDERTKLGYWLPVDAEKDGTVNWISNETITNNLKAMESLHVLVIADSCYSGTLTRSPGTISIEQGDHMEWIRRKVLLRSRTALTSGMLEPVLDGGGGDDDDDHSVFASSFLKALKENCKIVTMHSLFDTFNYKVVSNANQTPNYKDIQFCGHDDVDFVWYPHKAISKVEKK